jgi:hypothetical protein
MCAGTDFPTSGAFGANRACTPVTHITPSPQTASFVGVGWSPSTFVSSTIDGLSISVCLVANGEHNGTECKYIEASDPTFAFVRTESMHLTDGMVLGVRVRACNENKECDVLNPTARVKVQSPLGLGPLKLQFASRTPARLRVEWRGSAASADTAYYDLALSCLLRGSLAQLQRVRLPANSSSVVLPLAASDIGRCGVHTTLFAILTSTKKHAGLPSRSSFSGILLQELAGTTDL